MKLALGRHLVLLYLFIYFACLLGFGDDFELKNLSLLSSSVPSCCCMPVYVDYVDLSVVAGPLRLICF